MLEETGAAYEPVRVALAQGEQRTPEYLRIDLKGRVPALTEGDWALTENPAILRYLARRFPRRGCGRTTRVRRRAAPSGSPGSPRTIHVAYAHVRRPERYASDAEGDRGVVAKGKEVCRDPVGPGRTPELE